MEGDQWDHFCPFLTSSLSPLFFFGPSFQSYHKRKGRGKPPRADSQPEAAGSLAAECPAQEASAGSVKTWEQSSCRQRNSGQLLATLQSYVPGVLGRSRAKILWFYSGCNLG